MRLEKYDQWDWNYGKSPAYEKHSKARFPGGSLELHLSVAGGKITGIKLFGDFLAVSPVTIIENGLVKGCPNNAIVYEERGDENG